MPTSQIPWGILRKLATNSIHRRRLETPNLARFQRRRQNPLQPRVLFINRSYWPDAEATGQLLPNSAPAHLAPRSTSRSSPANRTTTQPRDHLSPPRRRSQRRRPHPPRAGTHVRQTAVAGRIINYLSFLWSAFWAAFLAKRPDVVVVETDPPLLCLIGWYLKRVRGAKLVVYLQDIHPDIGVALRKISNGPLRRLLRRIMFRTYRAADRVIVLSHDMPPPYHRFRCRPPSGSSASPTGSTPITCGRSRLQPLSRFALHNRGKFVVMYSGQPRACQRLEDVIAAADHLRERPDILFLLIGERRPRTGTQGAGSRTRTVERPLPALSTEVAAGRKPQRGRSASACRSTRASPRASMPSKLYGVLASGTPLLTIAPADCELAELIREHNVGIVTPPGKPEKLANAIVEIANQTENRRQMGTRARPAGGSGIRSTARDVPIPCVAYRCARCPHYRRTSSGIW